MVMLPDSGHLAVTRSRVRACAGTTKRCRGIAFNLTGHHSGFPNA
jgi:hypothetical protein